jgi:hypothetical protein
VLACPGPIVCRAAAVAIGQDSFVKKTVFAFGAEVQHAKKHLEDRVGEDCKMLEALESVLDKNGNVKVINMK